MHTQLSKIQYVKYNRNKRYVHAYAETLIRKFYGANCVYMVMMYAVLKWLTHFIS